MKQGWRPGFGLANSIECLAQYVNEGWEVAVRGRLLVGISQCIVSICIVSHLPFIEIFFVLLFFITFFIIIIYFIIVIAFYFS